MRTVPTRLFPRLVRNLAMAAAVSAVLSACVVYPAREYYGPTVGYAPPAAQIETVGIAPVPGYIWIGGYWNWVGGRYSWIPGRWEAPRPGYRWVAPHWEHYGRGWHMTRGGWRPR